MIKSCFCKKPTMNENTYKTKKKKKERKPITDRAKTKFKRHIARARSIYLPPPHIKCSYL